ncbi:MAG: type III-A CRISPR-associated protein Csm2 [Lachnospiraceae bacterium]|nr:type III-A CRISPR-associated protein Csm2 [Lachnospiraceae bacterium]
MIITQDNYVKTAEEVILKLKGLKDKKGRDIPVVTTSKIRNLLSMTAEIYNEVLNYPDEKLDNKIRGKIDYLKIRFVYEAGREESVKRLIECADIINVIDNIKGRKSEYILFSHYIEALVAYRKFHVRNDG